MCKINEKERYKFIQQSKCFAIVCSHRLTYQSSQIRSTCLSKVLTVSPSQRLHRPWHNLNKKHISIYLQSIINKSYTIHTIKYNTKDYNTTEKLYCSCKTHKMTNTRKITTTVCVALLGPLSRLLATFSHVAVPNHDQHGRTFLSSHGDSSADRGWHSTGHPSSSAKTQLHV